MAAIEERDVRAYRVLQGMLSVTRSHPTERIDWACSVVLENRSFRYQILRQLVEKPEGAVFSQRLPSDAGTSTPIAA